MDRAPAAKGLLATGSLALLLSLPAPLRADVIDTLNEVRSRGCEQLPGQSPLRASARLDDAARTFAEGSELRAAMSRAGYRAVKWAAVHIPDASAGDDAVAHVLGKRFCSRLADPAFRDVGVARRERGMWIVFAAPFTAPAEKDAAVVSRRVLELTNEARSRPRRCGGKAFAATTPLKPAPALDKAALGYARDLAAASHFSHTGRDGSTPAQRATRAGYRWRGIGENIAAGPATADIVVPGWIESPEHCANLMNPGYTETGIAYAVDPASKHGIYWVQMFGAPR